MLQSLSYPDPLDLLERERAAVAAAWREPDPVVRATLLHAASLWRLLAMHAAEPLPPPIGFANDD